MRLYLDDDSAARFWLVSFAKQGTMCSFHRTWAYQERMTPFI
jgi:hypothetical protein